MDRIKSLEFLQACIDNINNMHVKDVENIRQVYNEEMSDWIEKTNSFEVILPMEVDISFNVGENVQLNQKCSVDYKTPRYREMCTDFFNCVAA